MSSRKEINDPAGRPHKSIADMCKSWNIEPRLYYDRIGRGYTMSQALGLEKKPRKRSYTPEDLKSEFGIPIEIGEKGIRLGLSLRDIKRLANGRLHLDHKEKPYDSFSDMCKAYGVTTITVKKRMAKGWTLQQALENDDPELKNKKEVV